MKDTMIGVDLAKRVFQLHGATMAGEVRVERDQVESLGFTRGLISDSC
jgi:hypothetical protein